MDFDVAAHIYYHSNNSSYIDFDSFVIYVYNYGLDPVDYADYGALNANYNQNFYWREWYLDVYQGETKRDELFLQSLVNDRYITSTRFYKNDFVRTQILGCIGDVVSHGTFETYFEPYGYYTDFYSFAGWSSENEENAENVEVLQSSLHPEETALLTNQEIEITTQLEIGANKYVDTWLSVSDVRFVEYPPTEEIDLSNNQLVAVDFTANEDNTDKFPRKGYITLNGETYDVLSTTTSFDENNHFTGGTMLFILPSDIDMQMKMDSTLDFNLTITDVMEISK